MSIRLSRRGDRVFRIGGEEFAVLASASEERQIVSLMEKIRKTVEDMRLQHPDGADKVVTISLGGLLVRDCCNMANVIARCNRPALVLAPNKTLAAQLYGEFRGLFPRNAVEYFVSYYDYYQPEAYVPASDTYIEKDSSINDNIDKLRHAATHALLTRRDVVIVASVSCIYGLGSPEYYAKMVIPVEVGQHFPMPMHCNSRVFGRSR